MDDDYGDDYDDDDDDDEDDDQVDEDAGEDGEDDEVQACVCIMCVVRKNTLVHTLSLSLPPSPSLPLTLSLPLSPVSLFCLSG